MTPELIGIALGVILFAIPPVFLLWWPLVRAHRRAKQRTEYETLVSRIIAIKRGLQ